MSPSEAGRAWRAWYADGKVYSSAAVAWAYLPAEGIVGAVEYLDPSGSPQRRRLDGADWIWMDEDGVLHASETHPEWGQFVDPPEGVPVEMLKKSGRMPDEAWERVRREMLEARTWP